MLLNDNFTVLWHDRCIEPTGASLVVAMIPIERIGMSLKSVLVIL